MFPSITTLKEDARSGLAGVWKNAIGLEFLSVITGGVSSFYAVIALIAGLLIGFLTDQKMNVVGSLIAIAVLMALLILNSGIRISVNRYYMALVHNPTRDPDMRECNMMGHFANRFFTTLQVQTINAFLLLFLVVPGVISMMKYAMVDFVLADNPDLKPVEAMNESAHLMDGHKANFFKFCLSFLPWFILGAIPFGIGLFWAIPYFHMACAHYYQSLVNPEWENSADNDEIKSLSAEHFSYKDFVEELEHKRGSGNGAYQSNRKR